MYIPLGKRVTTTLEASRFKSVCCEECGGEFCYVISRKSVGMASSVLFLNNAGAEEKSEERASASLERFLDQEFDAVPCRFCGVYQPRMAENLKANHGKWLRNFGLFFALVAAVSVALFTISDDVRNKLQPLKSYLPWIFISATTLASIILWAYRRAAKAFDPNATQYADRREKIAADRTLSPEEVAELIELERQRQAENALPSFLQK